MIAYVQVDENDKVLMLMKDKHPRLDNLQLIELSEEEYEKAAKELQRYKLVTNEHQEKKLVYVEQTEEEKQQEKEFEVKKLLARLRVKRERECFSVVNRGNAWYQKLTAEQSLELNEWYEAWLAVTETLTIPEKPNWIK